MASPAAVAAQEYRSGVKPVWCPGCGDYGVLNSTYRAMDALALAPHEVVVVSGIGCSSRFPYFVRTYGFHGVHGRALPVAQGVKLANPSLTVFAVGGDGDFFSIGAGHLPHCARRNVDITCIVMDNEIYGLTKGQTSPTSPHGHKTRSTPYGAVDEPLNPIALAIAYGATFVARGYAAKTDLLANLVVQGVQHKGFSFIQVLSPCTAFYNTYQYFNKEVVEVTPEHDPSDRVKAFGLALEAEAIHLGVFYRTERPTLEDEVAAHTEPQPFDVAAFLTRYR